MQITDTEAMLMVQNNKDRRYAAQQINLANGEIRRLRGVVSKLEHKLSVEVAHAAGTSAMVRALREQNPDLLDFKPTGWLMPDGRDQLTIHLEYDKAFDAKALELGLENPHAYREVAIDPVAEAAEARRKAEEEEAARQREAEIEASKTLLRDILAGRHHRIKSGAAISRSDDEALAQFRNAPNYKDLVWETSRTRFSLAEKLAFKLTKTLPTWAA